MNKLLLFLLMLSSLSQARDVVDTQGECKINWTQGYISCQGESAEGQSRFAAKISSKVIAQRNLLEVVNGVQIDSTSTIKDGIFSSEIIKSRVSGVIKGAEVIVSEYHADGGYGVTTLKLRMGKDLLAALLSDPNKLSWNEKVEKFWNNFSFIAQANASTYMSTEKETIKKLLNDLRTQGDSEGVKYLTSVLDNMDETQYTGVLIDVSTVENFKKAMIVRLVDTSGKEIYPANLVSKKTLLKQNTSVGYIYGFDDARKNKRVFNTPIELKVSKVYKHRYSNIVLSRKQIEQLESINKDILHKAKIILVLGD